MRLWPVLLRLSLRSIYRNGDVRSVQDAKLMIEELGVDAVMVGRAAMNNPYIFTQINHFFETGEELPELHLIRNWTSLKTTSNVW